MQGGSFGKKLESKQLIPESKLTQIISKDDATDIVNNLNTIKDKTNETYKSFDEYFTILKKEGQQCVVDYVKENKNQVYVTDDVIDASKKARAEQIAYNETIRQSTLAFKAASIAKRIFATIGNMAAMWALIKAIGAVTETIGELVHSEENLRQSGSELSNNSSDIEGYKKKIEELKAVINDSSSSFDEVSQARVDLMAIQDELIEKFGTEKGVIESITSAINDQTDALDELSRRAYFQKKNEFNEKNNGDKVADWLSFGNTSDDRIQSNMDKMVSTMRYSFYELETTGNEVLDNLIAKSYGLNIVEDMYGDGKHFQIYGALDEIQDKLYGIQELSQDFDLSTGFENSFTKISNDVDDALIKFKNLYDQYVLYEKILTDNPDNQYDEQFDLINKAKEAYNEAVKSGNEENIKTSADEYAKTLQSAIDLAMGNYDYDVADYFKAMYPELQQMFGEWQFSLNFEPNTDGLQDKVADALDSIDGVSDGTTSFSVEDIENFNPNVATQEQIDAYGELTNVAETYSLTIKQLIALLQTMGLIQSESYQQLVDTFGQDNVDKLSPEDLEIAYKIENVGNMTFEQLQTEIEKTKQQTNETGISPLSISQTIDQLNTQLKPAFDSLQSAYQDIFTDDGKFALNSIDILSTCDTIKSKLDEMSDPEGLNLDVDYSAFEDFVRVLNNTESTEQDVENAFDSLATSITQAALSGAEDFETMKSALEDLGVANNEMVAFQALASNTEMLEQALSEANASMDDFIVNTEDGSVEATNAGRAFLEEKVGAENCAEALNILAFHKQLCNLQEMNTAGEVANLKTLAENAGYTGEVIQYLTELEQIYQEVASSTLTKEQILVKTGRATILKALIDNAASNINYEPKVDWNNVTKDASKAGSSAGDAYVDAFEEELKSLQDLRDRGVIDESEYLQRLRELYTRYFADRKEYLNEFKKYERQYLEGMKSLYDSALSGITKLMSHQIDGYNEAKDAAVSSLEAEKEARLEVIETQKEQLEAEQDLIDKQIEAKQDIIDSIQKEIDAMKAAREERQRQLDLQKALYDLESLKHQHTIRQYSEEKGIHYVTDDSAIRDAQEKVDDAKFEIEVSKKEKEIKLIEEQISLLEKQKEAIQDQIDALDKQSENIEKYYSKLISEQEKYWDSMISNMEKQKSKWEELAEVEEIAKAYSAIEQVFGDMGYTVQDILNGNGQAFEDFKSRYIAIMSDMNQNTSFQEGLEYASGVAKENFGSIVSDAQGAVQELSQTFSDGTFSQSITQGVSDGIVSAKQELDKMDQLGKDAGDGLLNGWDEKANLFIEAAKQTAQDAVDAFAEGQESHSPSEKYKGLAGDAIDGLMLGVEENKQSFIDTIRSLAEDGLLAFEEGFQFDESSIKTSFDSLIVLIQSVSEALGFGSEGSVNGLLGALSQLSAFSLGDDGKGILSQFESLKTAVDGVVSAISGGSASGGSVSGSSDKGKESGAGGGSGLVGAIESFKSATDEALGSGGGESSEGEGSEGGGTGAIGQFEQLKSAVDDVTTAIGSEGSEGSEGSVENSDTLIGSIDDLGTSVTDTLGESGGKGIIGKFEEFKGVIEEAAEHVTSISDGLEHIDGQEVECMITVNVKMNGSFPQFADGTVLGQMQIESATYNAQYGKAFASGTIGLPKAEKNALVSEYGQTEMTVLPDGKTIITDTPTMMDLPKDTVIYNEEETKKIMDNKVDVSGNAHANGTDDSIWTTLADGTKIRPLQPGDKMYDLQQKFEAYFKSIDGNLEKLVPNSFYERNKEMNKLADQISYANSIVNNNKNVQQPVHNEIHVTLPNVTNSTSAESLLRDLQSLNTKKYQVNW